MELMAVNPRKRFGLPMTNDFTVWNLDRVFTVEPERFLSMGRATPFAGHKLYGECVATVCDGKLVYNLG